MAVGLTVRGELAAHGPAKLVRGDLHSSGRPALEQVEVNLEDNEEPDAGHDSVLAITQACPLLVATQVCGLLAVELRSLVSCRIREGHGARGPPLA